VKITEVAVSRKFNLGNYEMLEVGLEAALTESDNPLNALKNLEDMAELYLQSRLSNDAQPEKKAVAADSVLLKFPPEYRQHLTVKNGDIHSEYVSKERFNEINQVARSLGYEYVSAGKESHWRKR
jgi:hypothetical protein